MARPIKSGADYFPLDVIMDDKIKLLEAEYGLKGFAILIKLYQKIYSCGYYCSFTSDVGLLFAKHNAASIDFVNEIIACCIRRDIFDKALYDKYSVLTSKGIQERYLEIKKRATNIILDKRYLLLSDTILSKYATITIINVDNNEVNASNNTQSKVNESKEKKSKTNGVVEFFENNIGFVSPCVLSDIKYYLDKGIEDKLIITCLKKSVDNNKRNWSYAKGILKNLIKEGIKTQKQYDTSEVEKNASKIVSNKNNKNSFAYDYEDTGNSL